MCEKAVRGAVKEVDGVKDVRIDREAERVWVDCAAEVSAKALVDAIESAGKFQAEVVNE